jgi:ribosomal protein S12 methylthiotransferase accessory factor
MLGRFGVTRIADVTGLDRIGIPVATAIRPMARSVAVAAGKGLDTVAAKVSASMEAIELAHAEAIDRPLVLGSFAELSRARPTADPFNLPLLPGHRLMDGTRILWIEGRELAGGSAILIPYELVHAHYCPPAMPGAGFFLATTNGLSSGNAFAEAVCHGLFEVIERDALARWSRLSWTERNDSRLHLSPQDESLAAGPLDLLDRAGFDVLLLWDITSDIGVPAFHCLILDGEDPAGHPGTGTGCHLDKEVALCRAILEAVQVRATYISGGRDDLRRREYETGHMASFRRAAGAGERAPRRPFADIPSVATDCFEDDLAYVLERLSVCGLPSPIVVDLSLPDSGIAVVRVVAPGLEGPQDTAPTEVLT